MGSGAPREVGGYRIIGPLGQGGMGAVYRALDGDDRAVALKLLHPHLGADDEARERLQREVANLQRVRHPGVARVLDAELESTDAFVVTELVDGLDLAEHVHLHGRLSPFSVAKLAEGLRAALAVVHAAGVLHRDLTPGNVMVTDAGPVLIDFGIAQGMEDSRVTSAGLVAGTPGYVAPELLDGAEPSEQSDWWGWAALVAFAAVGRPPFGTGPARSVLARTRSGDLLLTGLAPRSDAALRAALARDPLQRPTPDQVVVALRRAAAGDTELNPLAEQAPWQDVDEPDDSETRVLDDGPRTRVLDDGPGAPEPGDWPPVEPDGSDDADWDAEQEGFEQEGFRLEREPARRAVPVIAGALALLFLGAARPGVALAVATGLAVAVRSVGLDVEAVRRRRARRGARAGDTTGALLSWPWYVIRAVLGVLPAVLVTVSAVLLAGGIAWWLVGGHWVIAAPAPGESPGELAGNAAWVTSAVVMVIVGIGLLTLWFGPMSRATRRGVRWTFAGPTGRVGAASVTLAALVAAMVLSAMVEPGQVAWWPMSGPPGLG
jgi:serine/threonine protein kinase